MAFHTPIATRVMSFLGVLEAPPKVCDADTTVAALIRPGSRHPTAETLASHGLQHPPHAHGWFPLTDGSALGLLRIHAQAPEGVLLGQAMLLVDMQVVGRLVVAREYSVWPVHDRELLRTTVFNSGDWRLGCPRSCCRPGGLRSLFQLTRGEDFVDTLRRHFGEEVGFLFAWHSHYLRCLGCLALATMPFLFVQTHASMLLHAALIVCFGIGVTEWWPAEADKAARRWHSDHEIFGNWRRLVRAVILQRRRHEAGAGAPPSAAGFALGARAGAGCSWVGCPSGRSLLKLAVLVLMVLLEWALMFMFFCAVVWFEMWVIFDWGGCGELNARTGSWDCLSAERERGWLGSAVEALPSICEGVFFELIIAISKIMAGRYISLFEFSAAEDRDYYVISVAFLLEVVGKVGFVLVLAVVFVPVWSDSACGLYWDYAVLGEGALSCIKGQVPPRVRLQILKSAMKGPMLVSGLVAVGVKTLLPLLLETLRSLARETPRGGRRRACRTCCAPADVLLRVLVLIFQADWEAVGGLRMLVQWPHTLSAGGGAPDEDSAPPAPETDRMLREALLEGQRREYDPYDEYMELLLHFLWMACFGVIWPLGSIFALMNQLLEYRFDCVKLAAVRRRRFPRRLQASFGRWVPCFARRICFIGIVVNAAILVFSYGFASHVSPTRRGEVQSISEGGVFCLGVAVSVLAPLLALRVAGVRVVDAVVKRVIASRREAAAAASAAAAAERTDENMV